jgi:hypothetical protein
MTTKQLAWRKLVKKREVDEAVCVVDSHPAPYSWLRQASRPILDTCVRRLLPSIDCQRTKIKLNMSSPLLE